jgi:hypothetical protein
MDPQKATEVAAWGFGFGVFGTAATIVGFTLTFMQLSRTINATQAAAKAIASVKSRVAAYDAVFEISRATSSLKETERHLKRHSWQCNK